MTYRTAEVSEVMGLAKYIPKRAKEMDGEDEGQILTGGCSFTNFSFFSNGLFCCGPLGASQLHKLRELRNDVWCYSEDNVLSSKFPFTSKNPDKVRKRYKEKVSFILSLILSMIGTVDKALLEPCLICQEVPGGPLFLKRP